MDCGIRIGGEVDKQAVEEVSDSIERIFAAAFNNRMDQETVRHALDTLGRVGQVANTTVTGCNVSGAGPRY